MRRGADPKGRDGHEAAGQSITDWQDPVESRKEGRSGRDDGFADEHILFADPGQFQWRQFSHWTAEQESSPPGRCNSAIQRQQAAQISVGRSEHRHHHHQTNRRDLEDCAHGGTSDSNGLQ